MFKCGSLHFMEFLGCVRLTFFMRFGKFSAFISSRIFLPSLLSWNSHYVCAGMHDGTPHSVIHPFFTFPYSFFCLKSAVWVQFSSEILISVILFNSKFLFGFFLYHFYLLKILYLMKDIILILSFSSLDIVSFRSLSIF